MSRAFVNEDQIADSASLPDRQVSDYPNYVTPRGLALLERRLAELTSERSALRNSEEMTAKERLASVERELRYYGARVESAKLVPRPSQAPERVTFGSQVAVATPDGEAKTYILVGEDEAEAERGLISWVSPLGNALLGARKGDVVVWRRPTGDLELEVVEIGLPEQSG